MDNYFNRMISFQSMPIENKHTETEEQLVTIHYSQDYSYNLLYETIVFRTTKVKTLICPD